MMSRLIVFALVASLGNTSVAFAAESLLDSGKRIVRDPARDVAPAAQAEASPAVAARTTMPRFVAPPTFAQSAQSAPAVSTSGMRKRTKAMIMIGAAAA